VWILLARMGSSRFRSLTDLFSCFALRDASSKIGLSPCSSTVTSVDCRTSDQSRVASPNADSGLQVCCRATLRCDRLVCRGLVHSGQFRFSPRRSRSLLKRHDDASTKESKALVCFLSFSNGALVCFVCASRKRRNETPAPVSATEHLPGTRIPAPPPPSFPLFPSRERTANPDSTHTSLLSRPRASSSDTVMQPSLLVATLLLFVVAIAVLAAPPFPCTYTASSSLKVPVVFALGHAVALHSPG